MRMDIDAKPFIVSLDNTRVGGLLFRSYTVTSRFLVVLLLMVTLTPSSPIAEALRIVIAAMTHPAPICLNPLIVETFI
jgi:hypothetical protein